MKTFKRRLRNFAIAASLLVSPGLASSLASAQTAQATPPPPATPRPVQFPKPVEKTLANGLRVIVIDRPGTPLVTAQLVIKNGGEVDPPELAGLGNMLADLVTTVGRFIRQRAGIRAASASM
jgi:zinc protease